MNLNLGICREEEKTAKKQALIDYMLKHLKVPKGLMIKLCLTFCLIIVFFLFRDINFMQFAIGFVNSYV